MTITVHIELGYEFSVKAPAAEVFGVLSDVPTSASHFPKVHQLVDLGNNTYRWEMEKIGLAQVNLQTIYASKYTSNKAKGTVVEDDGNGGVGAGDYIAEVRLGSLKLMRKRIVWQLRDC